MTSARDPRLRLRRIQADRWLPGYRALLAGAVVFATALAAYLNWAVEPRNGVAGSVSTSVWYDTGASDRHYRTPDGSTIELKAGSKGRYSNDSGERVFELHQGRGYFDVFKQPQQDFTVIAGRYRVHVTGTRFSVNYDPAGDFGVRVYEGRVAVHAPERSDRIALSPGHELSVHEGRLTVLTTERLGHPKRDSKAR